MTDNTQPDAGSTHIIRYALEMGLLWIDGDGRDKVSEALDALDTLEAQLEAIGAGGVSGPLIGQPQAMPDLSALTERGAKAWAGVDAQALREGRWYMVNKDGMATLCADRADAEKEAADANLNWPKRLGPHRAVRLVEASFDAADVATAAADGFRDGAAEVAKLKGQRMVLCSLLRECLPVIDALMQMPGDDDSDAHLNGLAGRITGALDAIAEDQVKGGES